VITTALALQQGLKTTDSVKCTPTATVEGKSISNDTSLANGIPNATLKDAFEASCNTAFVNLALDGKLGTDYSALSTEAKTYFGLNQKWDLGLGPATYGTAGDQQVPPADGQGLFARDAFGQGNISMSPLTMASVAATVCTGQFHQPILVPGTQQIPATALAPGVDSQLTTLMKGVVSSSEGTAYGIFPGISDVAAKTGSAESNDTPRTHKTDSWMIVFDKSHDIAFGALVLNGGFGVQAAGPAIDTAMKQLQIH
jgi:cell division protein FtsI/penicillin-binding protein 2